MRFQQIIREYFSFTKNERIGLVVLVVLIGLILVANHLIFYFEKPGKIDPDKFQKLIALLEEQERRGEKSAEGYLFSFDPNAIDSIKLDSLQLPFYVKRNLLNYRSKGGRFYKAADFRKIYGMTDSIFDTIQPYIHIAESREVRLAPEVEKERPQERPVQLPVTAKPETRVEPIEINAATADELKELRGIGEVLSVRIVKYRQLLGGFWGLDQLHDVYGLKPETIENILPYLKLDSTRVVQINVNFASAEDLARHPYISYELAKALVRFRSENGFVNELQILCEKEVISEVDFPRISPYLRTKN
ncbi:helix-hairpin-helix domain-containing protein [uncultured Sunxiuqinia sp.]|uniref:helix-hairpin-helix domain-containing protein n=1 Tax=uncultured Sunxiuqinia sp. TaxID=1573825 RepID=UPI002622491E|nr:helix-hairpin-helix domain-containing protein [uncultured Sunxiuqinia sp.]